MSEGNEDRARANYEFVNHTGRVDVSILHPEITWHVEEALEVVGVEV